MKTSNLRRSADGGVWRLLVASALLCSDGRRICPILKFHSDSGVFFPSQLVPSFESLPFSLPLSFFLYLSLLITRGIRDKREIRWEDEKSIRTGEGHHYAFAPPCRAGRPVTRCEINRNQRGVCARLSACARSVSPELCPPSRLQRHPINLVPRIRKVTQKLDCFHCLTASTGGKLPFGATLLKGLSGTPAPPVKGSGSGVLMSQYC